MLIGSGEFSLPSQRKLQQNNTEIKTVAVDVVEVEIERPKKTKKLLQWQTKVPHVKSPGSN